MTNEQLAALDAAATQGVWAIGNNVGVLFGPDVQIAKFGDFFDKELVPLNGGRWNADAQLCAAIVNAYRAGQLVVRTEPSEADVDRVVALIDPAEHVALGYGLGRPDISGAVGRLLTLAREARAAIAAMVR